MRALLLGVVCVSAALAALTFAEEKKTDKKVPAVLNFKMKSLDGKDVDLARYQGKVLLIVNVASECGLTPQYKGLQMLHDKYAGQGLVVLGVPANEFGQQEPGSNEDIAKFCSKNYGVKFDMLAKVVVKGDGQAPLYQHLTSKETNPKFGGDITWNFTKFLVDRNGNVSARFDPDVEPDAEAVTKAIEGALKK